MRPVRAALNNTLRIWLSFLCDELAKVYGYIINKNINCHKLSTNYLEFKKIIQKTNAVNPLKNSRYAVLVVYYGL